MDWLNSILAVLIGLLIRLAIPIVITALAITFLRAEDKRWQAEAKQIPLPVKVEKPYCWIINNCPPEKMKACKMLYSPEPCWQAGRQENGYLRESCLTCKVFRQAPLPPQIPAPIHQ